MRTEDDGHVCPEECGCTRPPPAPHAPHAPHALLVAFIPNVPYAPRTFHVLFSCSVNSLCLCSHLIPCILCAACTLHVLCT